MKKAFAFGAAAVFAASTGPMVYAPVVMAQPANSEAMSQAQAEDLSRELGPDSVDEAVAAGDLVAIDGGYALTSAGLQAAEGAALLVSPALIPVAIGAAVAIIGIGLVAVIDDDDAGVAGTDTTTGTTPPGTTDPGGGGGGTTTTSTGAGTGGTN